MSAPVHTPALMLEALVISFLSLCEPAAVEVVSLFILLVLD